MSLFAQHHILTFFRPRRKLCKYDVAWLKSTVSNKFLIHFAWLHNAQIFRKTVFNFLSCSNFSLVILPEY